MKKPLLEALNIFANSYKKMASEKLTKFKNELTPDQIQMLGDEITSLDALSAKLAELATAEPDNEEVVKLQTMVTDLQTALGENQTAFENKIAKMVEGKTKKQFANFVKEAVENKLFDKGTKQSIGITRFENANNANLNVIYQDSEIGITPSLVPTLIDYVRQISLNGQNSVAWNEHTAGTDASAIVAIGGDKPVKTASHTSTTTGTETLAVISKLPKQYKAAISMIADIYVNDLNKDMLRKLNSTLIAIVAAGSDIADFYTTIPTVDKAHIIDAIRLVAAGIKNLFPENRVVIGLSQAALFELDSVKDENGNYVTYDFAQKGIILVSIPVTATFTATSILGMSESVVRWYSDGLDNLITDQRYWDTNEIGLMIEVLNSLFVLRGCDALATCFDDYSTIITDMGGGVQG